MIAKPLVSFSATMIADMPRNSLFQPVGDDTTSDAKLNMLQQRRSSMSSYEKPSSAKKPLRRFRRSKRVSFASELLLERYNTAPENHSETNVTDLWFVHNDFQRFLKQAQQEAKTIRLTDDEEYLHGVDGSHSIAIRLAESINEIMHEEKLLTRIFKRLDMKNTGLARWCVETQYRGLERLASKQLRHAKHYIRREIKGLIVSKNDDDAQTTISAGSASTSSSRGSGSRLSAEKLALQYQKRTNESRLFARMMGLADELAAQQAYAHTEDEELL